MVASGTSIPTLHAARYLERLCKRFAGRARAEFHGAAGRIDLPLGPCHLSAGPDSLALRVEADDPRGLDNLQWLITRHLKQVAPKESLHVLWTVSG